MDMTNFTDGTIFDNIQKINAEMSKKMNLRVDLTSNSAVQDADAQEDKARALERKLDNYIHKFINLNANNEVVLDQARDALGQDNDKHLAQFEAKLQQNLSEIFKYTARDEAGKQQFRQELQSYVQQLHAEFEQIERKRMTDKFADTEHIRKLKEANMEVKKTLKVQERALWELREQLQEYNQT